MMKFEEFKWKLKEIGVIEVFVRSMINFFIFVIVFE